VTLLPDAASADVAPAKVAGYLLNTAHPRNGGKAAFFAAFGFDITQWDVLRDALRQHPLANDVVSSQRSPHGNKHVVRCSMMSPDGRNPCITTIWITDGDGPPRFVTAYPSPSQPGEI